jgi:hypothetical protein
MRISVVSVHQGLGIKAEPQDMGDISELDAVISDKTLPESMKTI